MLLVICLVLLESHTRWASSCTPAESIDECKSNVLQLLGYVHLYNNQINGGALIDRLISYMVYYASQLMAKSRVF